MARSKSKHIVVIGAGAFGGWTALSLLRAGAKVTLLDRRGAGNELSSSGGESRVIRHVYEHRHHVEMAQRSMQLWLAAEQDWGKGLFHRKGVLFMSRQGGLLTAAAMHMGATGVEFERMNATELAARYPQLHTAGFDDAIFEPGSGYIDAQRACVAVRDAFVAAGGVYRIGTAVPGSLGGASLDGVRIEGGGSVEADQYVFACGPWLGSLFPDLLGKVLRVTRQEVYFFRTPATQLDALNRDLPVWAVLDDQFWYGIPGADGLFKLANDSHGPVVDPESQSREPMERGISSARKYMETRFPGMRGAEYHSGRVCQYSVTPDADFILGRHPEAENLWILGGGSGHGFKHGPAVGEHAADCVLGRTAVAEPLRLERFRDRI